MSTGNANVNVSNQSSSLTRSIFSGDYAAADEGSFFTAFLGATAVSANAVSNQGLATANPAVIVNNINPAGGYNVYLRSIKLRYTTAVTGTTNVNFVGVLSPLPSSITTAGTAMTGPTNVNSASGTTSRIACTGGAHVVTTQASVAGSRIAVSGPVTSIIPIVLDQWLFSFGEVAQGNAFGTVITTTTSFISVACPPVIVAPGWMFTFGLWGASWQAAAAAYSYDIAFIERPAGQ